MDKLMYKTYLWPRNPESCTVSYSRDLVYDQETEDGSITEKPGELRRTVTGNGVFSGDNAVERFNGLAALLKEPEAGWLVHPLLGKISAYLVKLEMTQEPRGNYIAYSFKFLEASGTGQEASE